MTIKLIGDVMDLMVVMLRTFFFYFFILLCYRIMGKREIGQLSISDLTISLLIAELVAISIENRNDNTLLTVLPIALLVILEVISSFIELKHNRIKNVLDGRPSIIIKKGKLNLREMIKQRYSINDLLISLRDKSIKTIKDVDYAILETNGKLSIFEKNIFDKTYPMPLIIDGVIDYDTLININKTRKWLINQLTINNLELKNILYAFYRNKTILIVKKK